MATELDRPATTKLYNKYEHLAFIYAKKIWDYDRLGMTYDDVVQEFKAKIWYSVIMFLRRWKHFRETGKFKPTPLKFYIQSNLNSLIIDLSKKINGYAMYRGEVIEKVKGVVSIDNIGFDIGKHPNFDTFINWDAGELVVNGVDLLSGLSPRQSSMFKLYLKGHKIKSLKKLFHGMDVSKVIASQVSVLSLQKETLFEDNSEPVFSFNLETQD